MREYRDAGEWKVDRWGKRYRVIDQGGLTIHEYEDEVLTTAGALPEARRAEADEIRKKRLEEIRKSRAEPVIKSKRCSFSQTGKLCNSDCAFYDPAGCMASLNDAKGKKCPISPYTCGDDCALYHEGCELIRFIKGDR